MFPLPWAPSVKLTGAEMPAWLFYPLLMILIIAVAGLIFLIWSICSNNGDH